MVLKIISGLTVSVLVLVGIGWLGFQVDAKSFPAPKVKTTDEGKIKIPSDLPAPVARYAKLVFGDEIPVVKSALVMGRAEMRINGLTMPARFKFYFDAGKGYYHFFEMTWFGLPIMTANERYMNGEAIMDLPVGRVEHDANTSAAANQALWAEALVWIPSALFTDERVKWEAVDDNTARLIIPSAAEEEMITVKFDPQTGMMTEMSTMRYQNQQDTERSLWTNHVTEWTTLNGVQVAGNSETQWRDDKPWAVWHVEKIIYNLDVAPRMTQFGGDFED